jgi:hypothetical protein
MNKFNNNKKPIPSFKNNNIRSQTSLKVDESTPNPIFQHSKDTEIIDTKPINTNPISNVEALIQKYEMKSSTVDGKINNTIPFQSIMR